MFFCLFRIRGSLHFNSRFSCICAFIRDQTANVYIEIIEMLVFGIVNAVKGSLFKTMFRWSRGQGKMPRAELERGRHAKLAGVSPQFVNIICLAGDGCWSVNFRI